MATLCLIPNCKFVGINVWHKWHLVRHDRVHIDNCLLVISDNSRDSYSALIFKFFTLANNFISKIKMRTHETRSWLKIPEARQMKNTRPLLIVYQQNMVHMEVQKSSLVCSRPIQAIRSQTYVVMLTLINVTLTPQKPCK